MIVQDDMAVEGSVSGGCVEAVIDAAGDAVAGGTGQGLISGWRIPAPGRWTCPTGGKIAVMVTPLSKPVSRRTVLPALSVILRPSARQPAV